MKRTLTLCTVLALLASATGLADTAAASPKAAPPAWQPGVRAAIAYADTRAGEVSFAVRSAHRLWGWRVERTVPSASVLKAMLLVAYLDDPRVRNRPLTPADHALIDPMIQRSDNTAADRVLEFVGPAGVYGVAARAGMRKFTLDPTIWGLSQIDAIDQARFFLHIDAHVVPRHRATAMHLLATAHRASAGASANCACPAGSCTSRAAGARARARSSIRSHCFAMATCASRSPC